MTPEQAARIRAKKAATLPDPNLEAFEKKRLALQKVVEEDQKRAEKRTKEAEEKKRLEERKTKGKHSSQAKGVPAKEKVEKQAESCEPRSGGT